MGPDTQTEIQARPITSEPMVSFIMVMALIIFSTVPHHLIIVPHCQPWHLSEFCSGRLGPTDISGDNER